MFDEDNNVLSTPAYMLANSISDAASGIEKLVTKLVALA
ncbi:sigma cross-reacting protein 27A [Vibrio variabilis]|uniref:Sigma cross-reacting protein 27A n=1 Tax=Vibrio variabilis TaxID=990271 RepID=A0ABQ0JHC2_9VIBR|nr:sigma cross-reacting protein 27A [Vibrio variabilis]